MIYGSVCSGIESATVAWHPLGWRAAFYAEIEPFPSAVLAHHYPEVPNLGDITKFAQWPDADIDVLVGGTPCQSYSVAGLRAGLDDPRGDLMLTYVAIARRYRPRWVAWENVPGVLSSNGGRDFGSLLALLSGRAIEVPRDGWKNSGIVPGIEGAYGLAWRVLDAQFFNLAQRRARVFVVGSLGGWPSAAAVLFERASLSGNPPPSREARENVAGTVTVCTGKRRPEGDSGQLIARCDTAREGSRQDYETETLIAVDYRNGIQGDISGTPEAAMDRGNRGHGVLCFDETQITNPDNRCNPQAGDPSHPLAAGARPPTIAFDCKAGGDTSFAISDDVAGSLRGEGHGGGHAAVAEPHTLASRGRGDTHELEFRQDGLANALLTPNGGRGGIGVGAIATRYAVRRLTPRECERLQGFEDDYTLIAYRGKPAKDGPRYKALGNSKAVPCVRWIGRRIATVDALLRERVA